MFFFKITRNTGLHKPPGGMYFFTKNATKVVALFRQYLVKNIPPPGFHFLKKPAGIFPSETFKYLPLRFCPLKSANCKDAMPHIERHGVFAYIKKQSPLGVPKFCLRYLYNAGSVSLLLQQLYAQYFVKAICLNRRNSVKSARK